jgi:hypothetical protein
MSDGFVLRSTNNNTRGRSVGERERERERERDRERWLSGKFLISLQASKNKGDLGTSGRETGKGDRFNCFYSGDKRGEGEGIEFLSNRIAC